MNHGDRSNLIHPTSLSPCLCSVWTYSLHFSSYPSYIFPSITFLLICLKKGSVPKHYLFLFSRDVPWPAGHFVSTLLNCLSSFLFKASISNQKHTQCCWRLHVDHSLSVPALGCVRFYCLSVAHGLDLITFYLFLPESCKLTIWVSTQWFLIASSSLLGFW